MIGTPDVDLDVVGKTKVGDMDVEVIDPVEVRACVRACVCAREFGCPTVWFVSWLFRLVSFRFVLPVLAGGGGAVPVSRGPKLLS